MNEWMNEWMNGPEKPPEEGEMNVMTLPCGHTIRDRIPGGLRPSMLPFSHIDSTQYWIFTSERRINFCFFEIWMLNLAEKSTPENYFTKCAHA